MQRRQFLLLLGILGIPLHAIGSTTRVCPLCAGKLTTVGKVSDDRTKPSRNIEVWDRSIDSMNDFRDDSPICMRCWHAYDQREDCWKRASELPDSFVHPLSEGIRSFPLPEKMDVKSLVVYGQRFSGEDGKGARQEYVLFWSMRSRKMLDAMQSHADKWHLSLQKDDSSGTFGQIFVMAKTQ